MEVIGIILGLIGPLLFIGVIAAVVTIAVRRNSDEPVEPGIGTVRRVFFYGLAFAALMLATSGVTLLLGQLLDVLFGDAIIRDDSFRIAFGLAATIVGLPIWLLLWRAAERSTEQYPAEKGTLGRKFYVYLVLGISAVVVAVFLIQLIQGILDPSRFNLDVIAPLVVFGSLWGVHWAWERAEGQPSRIARSVRRLYAYVTSTYGLVLLAVGAGQLLARLLGAAYDALFGTSLLGPSPVLWGSPVIDSISLVVVGGIWWGYHWHLVSAGDADSVLRQVVVYLVGVFGGLVTMVASAAGVLLAILLWLFDAQAASPAVRHFEVVPGALAAFLIGAGLWRYHSEVVLQEAASAGERLLSARRAYRYLTAAVGLGTLAVGLTVLFGLVIGLLIPGARGDLTGTRWWSGPLATVLTLIIVGAPLWWRYWFMQQAAVSAGAPGEREALSRRIFIFAVFGIAVLATLGSLSTFLIFVLQPLFEGRLTAEALDGGKWALGIVLTAGTISVYYWQVLREDREALAAEAPALQPAAVSSEPSPAAGQVATAQPPVADSVNVTALAPAGSSATVSALAAELGMPVSHWQREDAETAPEVSPAQIAAAVEQVRAASADRVLVVIDASGIRVVPFIA